MNNIKGKTTLLNVLNFRNRRDLNINGDVKVNGEIVRNTANIALVSGYVQQEDIYIGYLKVNEQLKFQVKYLLKKHLILALNDI